MAKKFLTRKNIPGLIAVGAGASLLVSSIMRQNRRMAFRGASVIVTGGSRGLGLEMSRIFAREGARLTLLARDQDELERARRELIALGGYVMIRSCDIRDRQQVQQAVDFVIRERGRIDVLINNAGIMHVGPFENTDVRDFEQAIDVYVRAPLYFIKAAVPHMKRQGGGRIVNICSIGGLVAIPHLAAYSTGKFAETGLSDGVRAELAKDNILVTTVQPGLMRTGSYINAVFKGQHKKEFGWFALPAALPVFSANAEKTARRIVEACRYGDSWLIIPPLARVLHLMTALFPGVTAALMKLAASVLPSPSSEEGDTGKTGWEIRSVVAPSVLTRFGEEAVKRNNELKSYAT